LYVATGGSYLDEATGQTMTIPTALQLRAAMDTASATMSIAITPLTELAVEQAGTLLTSTNIANANQLVSSLFKFDIVGTQPLAPTISAFTQTTDTQAQKDYALALAGISQMAADYYGGSVTGVLAAMNNDITNNQSLSSATALQFTTSLSNFLSSSNNQTGVNNINATNLANAGGPSLTLKLVTTGQLPAGVSICGVQLTLTLPAGVTIRVGDFTASKYQADSSVLYSSGVAPANVATIASLYTPAAGGQPATLVPGVVSNVGWPLGAFLTVICDLPPDTSYTSANFTVSNVSVIDKNGEPIPGVTVVVQ
jgi:hypothetical protein